MWLVRKVRGKREVEAFLNGAFGVPGDTSNRAIVGHELGGVVVVLGDSIITNTSDTTKGLCAG